jgi:hypothetical protein
MLQAPDGECMTAKPLISLPLKLVAAMGVLVAVLAIVALTSAITSSGNGANHPVAPPAATLSSR